MQQRKANGHGCRHPRRDVADGDGELRRRAVRLADLVGHAGIGRGDVVVARLRAQRPGLAGDRDRAHDQPGIDPAQRLVVEACARHHAGRKILHQHVRLRHHRLQDLRGARVLPLQGKAALGMVVLEEVGALRRALRLPRLDALDARAIAMGRQLDLDHVGAELRQDARAGRPGHELRDVEHAIAGEHRRLGRHRHHTLAAGLGSGDGRCVVPRASPASNKRCSSRPMRSWPQNGSPLNTKIGTPKIWSAVASSCALS